MSCTGVPKCTDCRCASCIIERQDQAYWAYQGLVQRQQVRDNLLHKKMENMADAETSEYQRMFQSAQSVPTVNNRYAERINATQPSSSSTFAPNSSSNSSRTDPRQAVTATAIPAPSTSPPPPGGKAHPCSLCPKSFSHSGALYMHRKLHTGDFKYQCEYCDKPFVHQQYYERHRRSHTGERPYGCPDCGKRFTQPNTLTQHRRQHTGEKPYACEECGKQFGVRDYLNKHMRVHTGEKPYVCGRCEKRYSQLCSLRLHQKRHGHLPAPRKPPQGGGVVVEG